MLRHGPRTPAPAAWSAGRRVVRERRVGHSVAIDVGIAEVEAGPGRAVQLVRRAVVAEIVAAVVGEEQLAGDRLPVEADRVADAAGEDLELVAVRAQPDDRALEALDPTDVAGAPTPRRACRRGRGQRSASRGGSGRGARRRHDHLEPARGVEADDPMLLGDQQAAVRGQCQAVRHLQAAGDRDHPIGAAVALRIEDREHLAVPGRDVDPGATVGDPQRARPRHLGELLDREAWRQVQNRGTACHRPGTRPRPTSRQPLSTSHRLSTSHSLSTRPGGQAAGRPWSVASPSGRR